MKKPLAGLLQKSANTERKAVQAKPGGLELATKIDDISHTEKNQKTLLKEKVIKDTFTMPESDYSLLDKCKSRAIMKHHVINKSEIIRAGLILLNALSDKAFLKSISAVKKMKSGRPKT